MSDITLWSSEKGSGEALILLHGNGEDSSYFEHQIDFFSPYYRVIAVDTRGHGKSPRGSGEFTLSRFADDLYDFMLSKSIDKAHILGFSDGANIAILFALKHPESVGKLILNGGNIFPMGLKPAALNEIIHDWNIARRKPHLKGEEELLSLMVKEPKLKWDDLKKIRNDALVIVGEDDLIRRSHSEKIASSLPNGIFSEIEGGHDIAFSNSEEFNNIVISFLRNEG